MKSFLLCCIYLFVAISTVKSASYYYRAGREIIVPVVDDTVKEVVVSELKKDGLAVVEEAVLVPVVNSAPALPEAEQEKVVPIENLRAAAPAVADKEEVISENKVVVDEIKLADTAAEPADEARAKPSPVAKLETLEVVQPSEGGLKSATIAETVKNAAIEAVRATNAEIAETVKQETESSETKPAPVETPTEVKTVVTEEKAAPVPEVKIATPEVPVESKPSGLELAADTKSEPEPAKEEIIPAPQLRLAQAVPKEEPEVKEAAPEKSAEIQPAPAEALVETQPAAEQPAAEQPAPVQLKEAPVQLLVAEVAAPEVPAERSVEEPSKPEEAAKPVELTEAKEEPKPEIKVDEPKEAPKEDVPQPAIRQQNLIQQAQETITNLLNNNPIANALNSIRNPPPASGAVAAAPASSESVVPVVSSSVATALPAPLPSVPSVAPVQPAPAPLQPAGPAGLIQSVLNNISNALRPNDQRQSTTAVPIQPTPPAALAPAIPTESREGDAPVPIVQQAIEIIDDKVDLEKAVKSD